MARTWFGGPPTAQMTPKRGAVSETGDPPQANEGVLFKNKIAVNDFATVHQITPTKANHSGSESNGSVTRVTPFLSSQKELNTQPTKEAVDASANLAKLIKKHSKPKDPRITATSKEPTTSKPVETTDTFAPSSSAPRRAPTAQMVQLPPNVAATTTPAVTATPETSTTSLFGPGPSPTSTSIPQVFFPATVPPSLTLPSMPPSSPAASSKKSIPKKSKAKNPKIKLTPARATASSAFNDAALAAQVPNTRLLTPAKQQKTRVKKRQHVRTSSPPKSVLTPESVPEEQRARGRPLTRLEEEPLQQKRRHRSPVQSSTPLPRTALSNESSSSLCATSAFPLQQQQQQQQQQAVRYNINGDLTPEACSEEPRLWPGPNDYVASLLRFDSRPEVPHSNPVKVCANHAAHMDPHKPDGHGVCTTCRHRALRYIRATRPELLLPAWWPLCKACGDEELRHADPSRKGCSCARTWLCFSCQMQEVESRKMKDNVEAAFRRRTLVGKGMVGDVKTVVTGWACECGKEVEPSTTLMKCIGCEGVDIGKIDSRGKIAREIALAKTTLAWT